MNSKSGNIIVTDSIAFAIFIGIAVHYSFNLHPGLCTIIGIISAIIAMGLFVTKIGFWIVTLFFSACWGFIGCIAGHFFYTEDKIWDYTIFGIVFLFSVLLHWVSRSSLDS